MRTDSRLLRVFLLLPLLCLGSCLDYREELWINANGSGKIHATIAINSELPITTLDTSHPDQVESQLRDLFARIEGATVDDYRTSIEGRKRIYDFTVSFRDLRQLKPAIVSGEGTIGAVFGDFEITRIPDGRLSVKRVVRLADFEPDTPPDADAPTGSGDENSLSRALGQAVGGLFADAMLGNYHLDYVTHFPTEVLTANSPNIDHPARTVSWRFPLSQASKGPVTMTAEIVRPGRWMPWVFVGLVILVTVAILRTATKR